MGNRLDLHEILKTVLGSNHVYFQPPENLQMVYPCIVYERSYLKPEYADNNPYNIEKRYSVTVMDRNPDSLIPDKISKLSKCAFDRHFVSDNVNHDVFSIYF